MKKILAALAVVVVALVGLVQTATAGYEHPDKVFVCKYVGTPGVDERLQTGQNPISVSVNAIPDFPGIGGFFADGQNRSLVVAYDTGQGEPSCPDGQDCEEHCTPPHDDVCTNIVGVQESVPEGLIASEDENGRPTCVEPQHPVDVCENLQGNQSEVPPGYMLVNGACVPIVVPPSHPPCKFIGADKDGGVDAFGGTNDECAPRPTDPKVPPNTTTTTIVYVDRIVTPPIREITKTVTKVKTKVKVKVKTKVVVKYKVKIKKVYIEKKVKKCPKYTKLYHGVCAPMGNG